MSTISERLSGGGLASIGPVNWVRSSLQRQLALVLVIFVALTRT